MKKFILLLSILIAFFCQSQESPRPITDNGQKGFFLNRKHMEYFYKTLQINELYEMRKSECDTLVLSLEKKNLDFERKLSICDSIIKKQEEIINTKNEMVSIREAQIDTYKKVDVYQEDKIRRVVVDNSKLSNNLEKEKHKKWWFGLSGFAAGVCLVLFAI
jgi:hypothetical protein